MEDMVSQSLMSALSPPSGDQLATYLQAVAKELGLRSDSDLAREMELPASSIANWKRRKKVPEANAKWFGRELVAAAARRNRATVVAGTIPLNAIIVLIGRKDGDLLGYGAPHAAWMSGEAVPALYSLAQVVMRGPLAPQFRGADDVVTALLADLLADALPALRRLIRGPLPDLD